MAAENYEAIGLSRVLESSTFFSFRIVAKAEGYKLLHHCSWNEQARVRDEMPRLTISLSDYIED
jgi:hypothetical protein